ncbi:hypothetical protein QFC22_002719 [Naganishia vaughanmartiniae]|uniref:Uncharacterized protein n=1 Tax=Naganishia vaughanmartiniae TaxID=1424756 RepID=A0ACC2XAX5_9TREE|nr:hypothetical protein QFC22_002719 [Naganishia vaughanmartiniae]
MDDGMGVSSITAPLTVDPKASTSFFAPSSTGPVPMNDPATAANPQTNMVDMDQGIFNDEPGRKTIDLVFIQDATGSMGSYIASATKNIEEICNQIVTHAQLERPDDLRIAVVAYRDHPPQDHTYITKTLPFTSNISKVHTFLKDLHASGGGDGPEAVTAAMQVTLHDLAWRQNSTKTVVLVADAPPHGMSDYGDGFPKGDPNGHDPLQLAREMASRGIGIFMMACEPNLSSYKFGVEFFQAISRITSGLMLPLTTADLLAQAIIGSVLENLDLESLVQQIGQQVADRLGGDVTEDSIDAVAQELHEKLLLMGQTTKKVRVENIYEQSPQFEANVKAFMTSANLQEAMPQVKHIRTTKFTEAYRNSKYGVSQGLSRPGARRPAPPAYRPAPSLKLNMDDDDDDTSRAATPEPFKAFTPYKASTATTSPPGGFASGLPKDITGRDAFTSPHTSGRSSGARRKKMDSDDDDSDEDADQSDRMNAKQQIGLYEDAISLEQAKRIATQSIWRMRA